MFHNRWSFSIAPLSKPFAQLYNARVNPQNQHSIFLYHQKQYFIYTIHEKLSKERQTIFLKHYITK
jgi:hypothetical protein